MFVTRFPDGGNDRWKASVEGGTGPAWAHSGRELFYRTPSGELVAREVELGNIVRFGNVQTLFDASPYHTARLNRHYEVAPDDQRFLMIRLGEITTSLTLIRHWLDELKTLRR